MNVEQRINLKFLVKLGGGELGMFPTVKEVYGNNFTSHMQVLEWHKRFMESREEMDDDECLRRPSTSKTEENVEKISEIVDPRVKQLIKSTT
jgi:hypothetical protein